ncbi:MAG: type II toxin-antitoxin system Phd/YefM family antitoxin [Candidatus Accumulibacter sp.]|jgi:antitoxin (DNA-binding transcriptional repressor) of toxin-antitoxin stability system|nr:type II toxin-antitoxin system Phd/YefM family antitoxin [Accumulibacter sp.]
MQTVALAEAKSQFSALIRQVAQGREIAISYGKKKETVAVIVPYQAWKKGKVRRLGTLRDRGSLFFADDFSIGDEELIAS